MAERMPSQESVEWAAQLWCLPENSNRTMEVEFAMSIARAIDRRGGISNGVERKPSAR